ncbi:MAG TPA: S-ribosylhomocysteine lyase [Microbacteriaceae bacterium]|nr:S-ribosylhomocysteine lyase [Microbacteriaceae bacterium]
MEKHETPESFQLDHDAVKAPFVRRAGVHKLISGCEVVKWDLRFKQPNVAHLEMPAIHSIEHILATTFRTITDAVVDISPMGCQTGFYVSVDGEELGDFDVFTEVLGRAIETAIELGVVPGSTRTECGWAESHSLEGAKEALTDFLDARDEWAEVFVTDQV